jgi:hypothetical protein
MQVFCVVLLIDSVINAMWSDLLGLGLPFWLSLGALGLGLGQVNWW